MYCVRWQQTSSIDNNRWYGGREREKEAKPELKICTPSKMRGVLEVREPILNGEEGTVGKIIKCCCTPENQCLWRGRKKKHNPIDLVKNKGISQNQML